MTDAAPLRIIAEVTDDKSLLAAFRIRQSELEISHENLSELCGFPTRWTSKVLAPMPTRRFHPQHLGPLAGGLQVKLLMVVDEQARQRFGHRIIKRRAQCVQSGAVSVTLSKRFLRKIGALGGKNSRKNMTKRQASALARKAVAVRNARLSPVQRSESARKAAQTRWRAHGVRQASAP